MKPISAGLIEHDGRMINEDVINMVAASGQSDAIEDINPFALDWAVSPHIAAFRAHIAIDIATIKASQVRLLRDRQLLLIEGAGGWYAPINATETMADVARALAAPVLLVVGLKLGCLNHARLTLEAIRSSGLPLAGWIASEIDPDMLAKDENMATLEAIFAKKPLCVLPHTTDSSRDLQHCAQALPPLLGPALA
jgi:dethiobiotin synthetase